MYSTAPQEAQRTAPWARMKIKPAKSCRLSIRKGSRVVPVLAEQPVRNLGREYTAELTDRHMAATIMDQLKEGLKRIDQSNLPGKYKVHTLPTSDVTTEDVRDNSNNSRKTRCQAQQLHPEVAWTSKMPFQCCSVRKECSTATTEEHLTWIYAGEDQADTGTQTIKWPTAQEHRRQDPDRESTEGRRCCGQRHLQARATRTYWKNPTRKRAGVGESHRSFGQKHPRTSERGWWSQRWQEWRRITSW